MKDPNHNLRTMVLESFVHYEIMYSREPSGNWSRILYKGVDATFLDVLEDRIRLLRDLLNADTQQLNGTLESLQTLDALLDAHCSRIVEIKLPYESFPAKYRDISKIMFEGIIAYCGEIIKNRIQGSWHLLPNISPYVEDPGKNFHHPIIMHPSNGRHYDFLPLAGSNFSFDDPSHLDDFPAGELYPHNHHLYHDIRICLEMGGSPNEPLPPPALEQDSIFLELPVFEGVKR